MDTKTPKIALVHPASPSLSPPANLEEAGKTLWLAIQSEYRIDDAGGREMLLQICQAADTAKTCTDAISRDGPMIKTKTGFRDHPLLKHQLAARSFVVRSLHRLGLELEAEQPRGVGRPPGAFNPTR